MAGITLKEQAAAGRRLNPAASCAKRLTILVASARTFEAESRTPLRMMAGAAKAGE